MVGLLHGLLSASTNRVCHLNFYLLLIMLQYIFKTTGGSLAISIPGNDRKWYKHITQFVVLRTAYCASHQSWQKLSIIGYSRWKGPVSVVGLLLWDPENGPKENAEVGNVLSGAPL